VSPSSDNGDLGGTRLPGRQDKIAPDRLELRARPRPVTRVNRRVLLAVCGTGSVLLFGAAIIALDPPSFIADGGNKELYQVSNIPTPEGLEALPRSYADLKPEPTIQLGSPLPGDLGKTVVETERYAGVNPIASTFRTNTPPFRPDPEEDARRAERIRQAKLAQQAREATVFFQVSQRPAAAPAATEPVAAAADEPLSAETGRNEAAPELGSDPSLQGRKLAFLNSAVDGDIYNKHALETPISPYQVLAGTIIPASLITGINSDLPGAVLGQVTETVYDTVTGNHILIPQGARLIGAYDSVVAFGQERALVVWQRIVMPDGSSMVIDNLPGSDTAGFAGLADEVDLHTGKLVKGIAMATLLGVGTELTFGDNENDLVKALRESTQSSASQAGQGLVERNLNIQPTITIRPGWPVRVIVTKDLVLKPYKG